MQLILESTLIFGDISEVISPLSTSLMLRIQSSVAIITRKDTL